MDELDLATVLLQWATGRPARRWVTTRHRVVGIGYGWLAPRRRSRVLAIGGAAAGLADADRGAGATHPRRRPVVVDGCARRRVALVGVGACGVAIPVDDRPCGFPPVLDLLPPVAGVVALLGAADAVGGDRTRSRAARLVVGALFLGLVTDAMLLGHWYLVQPGLWVATRSRSWCASSAVVVAVRGRRVARADRHDRGARRRDRRRLRRAARLDVGRRARSRRSGSRSVARRALEGARTTRR